MSQTDTTVDEMTNHVKKKKQGVEIHRGKRHIRSLQFLKTVAILVQISTCQPLEAFIGQGIGKSTRKAVYLNDHPVPMKVAMFGTFVFLTGRLSVFFEHLTGMIVLFRSDIKVDIPTLPLFGADIILCHTLSLQQNGTDAGTSQFFPNFL